MGQTGQKIRKLLIANRGEIAVRILRTCRDMGIETVCVHSTADEDCLHVKFSDESVCIGAPKSAQSYLSIPAILSAAEITKAQAIHPGFGFLSENTEFAKMCHDWGLIFVGPSIGCIEKMGDKIRSKKIAEDAKIPVLRPIEVNGRKEEEIIKDVKNLGLPVLIKASAGGGGRGMMRIEDIKGLLPAIEKLKLEAKASFDDDTLFIEKWITNPRHVEVQVLGDQYGHVIHLGERDCTIQRRFQKLIEESPCPVLDEKTREEVCQAAVDLAKHVGYDSAGTVEFIYDQDQKKFYFMEMNTRIQVEHPVTEQRTGIDLIREMIKIASGDPLSYKQEEISFRGHSVECRINAEDPDTLMPGPGKIRYYYRPAGHGIRVDDFIYSGYTVPPFYDSMISKVITTGENRNEALARMHRALREMVLEGIKTNKETHLRIIRDEKFLNHQYSTNYLSS